MFSNPFINYNAIPIVLPRNPIVHYPIVHKPRPIVHYPIVHKPIVHNPIVHNPIVHNPIVHTPIIHKPIVHNPIVHVEPKKCTHDFNSKTGYYDIKLEGTKDWVLKNQYNVAKAHIDNDDYDSEFGAGDSYFRIKEGHIVTSFPEKIERRCDCHTPKSKL